MNTRLYNKLYVNKNRDSGTEKLLFGYQYDEKELRLVKDKETYFHVPVYAKSVKLVDTDLINNGAYAGVFPASSDRIFKSKKNYGNYTEHGNTNEVIDGIWFCSWLYREPNTGVIQWMDRFYNPGKFDYNTALIDLKEFPPYTPLNPVFRDQPSSLTFEPGVLYKYYHCGDQTANSILTTFEGKDGSRLKLHLLDWGTDNVDISDNKIPIIVKTDAKESEIYPIVEDSEKNAKPVLSFDHNKDLTVFLNYNNVFNIENEFTWSLWTQSPDWQKCESTQILGTYSTNGGIGLHIENPNSYLFIAVPETTYGHVFFVNQNGDGYLDKSVQPNINSVSPICFAIDSENNIIVANDDRSGVIYKMDHVGQIIRSTKNISDTSTLFSFRFDDEKPKQILCGKDDDIYVITNRGYYKFSKELTLLDTSTFKVGNNFASAFYYNIAEDTYNLHIENDCYDVKFVETDKWSIKIDGNLYKNDLLFQQFYGQAREIAIDPSGYIWVMHGSNNISIVNPNLESLLAIKATFQIGTDIERPTANRNLSFINAFDRTTNSKKWYATIYYSDETELYFCTLDGILEKSVNLLGLFDRKYIDVYKQDISKARFKAKGDMTGYERKRVFNQLSPIQNKSQLVLKANLRNRSKKGIVYSSIKVLAPIDNWEDRSWHHLALVYQNKVATVYDNGVPIIRKEFPGNYQVSYELQPPMFVGSPTGNKFGTNTEIGYTSCIFNGYISDIRVFNYAINSTNVQQFIKEFFVASDLFWSVPTPSVQYVEQVERMFKHKLPGAKSQFFNIRLKGTQITDPVTRQLIEEEIRDLITKNKPFVADLLKFEWDTVKSLETISGEKTVLRLISGRKILSIDKDNLIPIG